MMQHYWQARFAAGDAWTFSSNLPIAHYAKFRTARAAVEALLSTIGGAEAYRLMRGKRPVLVAWQQDNAWQVKAA